MKIVLQAASVAAYFALGISAIASFGGFAVSVVAGFVADPIYFIAALAFLAAGSGLLVAVMRLLDSMFDKWWWE